MSSLARSEVTDRSNVYEYMGPADTLEMRENMCYGDTSFENQFHPKTEPSKKAKQPIESSCKKLLVLLMILVMVVFALLCGVAFALAFNEIGQLKRAPNLDSLQHQVDGLQNQTNLLSVSLETLRSQLNRDFVQLGNNLNLSLEDAVKQLRGEFANLENETALTLNGTIRTLSGVFTSCAALPPSSPSGYYWVRNSIGSAVRVYCDMTRSCGGVTGGWMRVAELDMTDSSQQCPSGLKQCTDGNISTCVRSSDSAGCSSVTLPTSNIHYSRVCGRIIAYQVGATDAFGEQTSPNIDSAYVDGVSLTHGNPRQHIWTFAAALDESGTGNASSYCHCTGGSQAFRNITPPSFVSNNYFCDTGSQQHMDEQPPQFYSADPLWDGAGCGSGNTCCTFNTPPWFYKQLPRPTTDDIEMRVCRNDDGDDEDVAIEQVEIYIQ